LVYEFAKSAFIAGQPAQYFGSFGDEPYSYIVRFLQLSGKADLV
jgi:hypothetical protein